MRELRKKIIQKDMLPSKEEDKAATKNNDVEEKVPKKSQNKWVAEQDKEAKKSDVAEEKQSKKGKRKSVLNNGISHQQNQPMNVIDGKTRARTGKGPSYQTPSVRAVGEGGDLGSLADFFLTESCKGKSQRNHPLHVSHLLDFRQACSAVESCKGGKVRKTRRKSQIYPLVDFSQGQHCQVERIVSSPKAKSPKGRPLPLLPPLPQEEELFLPSCRQTTQEVCDTLLLRLDTTQLLTTVDIGQLADELQLDIKQIFLSFNILASLLLMTRTGLRSFLWKGMEGLEQCLVMLHQLAEEEKVLEQLYRSLQPVEHKDQARLQEKFTAGVLAQKLLMMFLVAPEPRTLTMGVASQVVFGPGARVVDRTRLTEICSVLSSLGLLRKVCIRDSRQPSLKATAFQYTGALLAAGSSGQVESGEVGIV